MGEHDPGAAGGLLGGLEEEGHIPGDLLPHGGEETGCAIEPGGVEVVATGMHDAGHLRHNFPFLRRLLDDGVNVGPEGYGGSRFSAPE